MKIHAIPQILPILVLLTVGICPAHAQSYVPVSNLNLLDYPTGNTNIISETKWTGSSFTTDNAAASFTLNSITLRMKDATVDNTFAAGFRVSLYTNGVDNKPGTEIANYSAVDFGTGEPVTAGDYAYAFGATLAANTTYWTVVSVQASQPLGIYNANLLISNVETDAGSTWVLNKYTTSNDAGASWGFASTGGLMMSINVTPSAIPEPSTYAALAGLVVLGLAVWRRRAGLANNPG